MTNKLLEMRDLVTTSYYSKNNKLRKLLHDTFKVNYFSYQRVDENGKFIAYLSDFDYLNYYLEKSVYSLDAFLVSPHNYHPGKTIHTFDSNLDELNIPIIDILKEVQQLFKFNQSIVIKKNYQSYYDLYIFSVPEKSVQSLDYLITQLPLLENFIDYFHREYKKELSVIENLNINIGEIIGDNFNNISPFDYSVNQDQLATFKKEINDIEYQLQCSYDRLTKRERECLFWLIQGKSAQETADILEISRRTVETIRENCRAKFGSHYTFSNLVYLLGKYNLI